MTSVNLTKTDCTRLVNAYRDAEKIIKRAENEVSRSFNTDYPEVQGLFMPAINELRYAGYHIVSFWENSDKIEYHLEEAISHCVRATCDAYDCVIQFYIRQCWRFLEEYSTVVLGDDIPDFNTKKVDLNTINRNPPERTDNLDEFFKALDQNYKRIVEIYNSFDAARDELNKKIFAQQDELNRKIAEQRELERKDKRNYRLALFSAFGGGAIVWSILMALVKWLWRVFS